MFIPCTAEQFDYGILSRFKRRGGRDFYPAAGQLLAGSRHQVLLLADFPSGLILITPTTRFVFLHLCAHDVEAVPGSAAAVEVVVAAAHAAGLATLEQILRASPCR